MAGGKQLKTDHLSADTLAQVAERHSATVAQISIAWLLHRSPVILQIPGTSKVGHLEENVAAAGLHLSPEVMVELEASKSSIGG
jgi:aryl-alcohol dehydrogenase-like predicted oxidoreductase